MMALLSGDKQVKHQLYELGHYITLKTTEIGMQKLTRHSHSIVLGGFELMS